MIEVEFGGGKDPRVWYNGEELTQRCVSLEILPGRKARIIMHVQPFEFEKYSNHIGCIGHLRKEVIQDAYDWRVIERRPYEMWNVRGETDA